MAATKPWIGSILSVSVITRAGGGRSVPPAAAASDAAGAANLCPRASFGKACYCTIPRESDPTLAVIQYREAWEALHVCQDHIGLRICATKVIIGECHIDAFSRSVKVINALITNSFKSPCVCSTEIGWCNFNLHVNIQPKGEQKENAIYVVAELRLISAWEFGQDLAGESIELNPDLATEQWLQYYVDPKFKIENKPVDSSLDPINNFGTHRHVAAWLDYFQLFLYPNHVIEYCTILL